MGHDDLRRPGRDHLAAGDAGPWPQVDHIVRSADRLLVVLNHQDGVAKVAQPLQCVEQPDIVPLVQTDTGLVQDVEDTHERAADLGRQTDALPLPSRQRGGRPIQRQVIQPDVYQESQPLPDLFQDAAGNLPFLVGKA